MIKKHRLTPPRQKNSSSRKTGVRERRGIRGSVDRGIFSVTQKRNILMMYLHCMVNIAIYYIF
jgi:hypothetical protein